MDIKGLLPIGSVVRLKEGTKKTMIIGVKQTSVENDLEYDYIGVLYPEGFIGGEYQFLFNHEDIEEFVFRGYEDNERLVFLDRLSSFFSK